MRFTQLAQVMPTTGTLSSAGTADGEVVAFIGASRILQGSIGTEPARACPAGKSPLPWRSAFADPTFGINRRGSSPFP